MRMFQANLHQFYQMGGDFIAKKTNNFINYRKVWFSIFIQAAKISYKPITDVSGCHIFLAIYKWGIWIGAGNLRRFRVFSEVWFLSLCTQPPGVITQNTVHNYKVPYAL
jgi:hypothetical protein